MYLRSKEIETFSLYIDGQRRPATTGTDFESIDP